MSKYLIHNRFLLLKKLTITLILTFFLSSLFAQIDSSDVQNGDSTILATDTIALLDTSLLHQQPVNDSLITIVGDVMDANSVPLSNVTIFFQGINGTRSDSTGYFRLRVDRNTIQTAPLLLSLVDFKDTSYNLSKYTSDTIVLDLVMKQNLDKSTLSTVVIKSSESKKYRNKNNPAVELIRKVIEHRDQNQMTTYETASYDKYEKLVASLSSLPEKTTNSKFVKKYQFFFQNMDTTSFPGKKLLPVYLNEVYSTNYYSKDPKFNKQIIKGENKVDFGEYIDALGITTYLKKLYSDVNVYDNNIMLFTNQFLSPISNMGPSFYKYYIRDTTFDDDDSTKLIRLAFQPRNARDMLFYGTLFITLDGNYAVQKANLRVPNKVNLNFMRELRIALGYKKQADGKYLQTKTNIIGDFGLTKKGTSVFGERTIIIKDFQKNPPISNAVKDLASVTTLQDATQHDSTYWRELRPIQLTSAESKTYQNVDSLFNMSSFKKMMDWATLFLAGYKQMFHSKFEMGPASTFYSFNPVEGFRLRWGGRSTPHLSKRYYFETYGAYGFKDQRFKYFGSFTYSINNKSIYKFPQHYIRGSFQHDTKIPGQDLQFVQEDNFFLSFKRGNNDKWLYNDLAQLVYKREFENHFSYEFDYKYWKQSPAGTIYYLNRMPNIGLDTIRSLKTSDLSLTLRYAPNEQFYQGKLYRTPMYNQYPIFTLRYVMGIKGLTGSEYNYHNIEANIFKRTYLSTFGYSDITLDGAYIAGKLPFPLLAIHHANQTYAYQIQSYNLMNFMEFVSDHYVAVNWDHYFNGFIFNKIPLLNELKWRAVMETKAIWGGVRNENNPNKNPSQMLYPTTDGSISTFSLNGKPYWEGGFGIANIFKFLRVDYIKRFTYLNNPNIPKWGIRFYLKFDF